MKTILLFILTWWICTCLNAQTRYFKVDSNRKVIPCDTLFQRALKADSVEDDTTWLTPSFGWRQVDTNLFKSAGTATTSFNFTLDITGTFSSNLSLNEVGTFKQNSVYYWYNSNKLVFTTSTPYQKTGKTIIHIHRSQVHWINDTTVVVMPYKKPKHKVRLNYFPNHSRIRSRYFSLSVGRTGQLISTTIKK